MILYYAGVDSHVAALYTAVKHGCRHLMLSFHYKNSKKQLIRFRRLGLHLFLDSGAFSSWRKGVEINLAAYMRYIKENNIGRSRDFYGSKRPVIKSWDS